MDPPRLHLAVAMEGYPAPHPQARPPPRMGQTIPGPSQTTIHYASESALSFWVVARSRGGSLPKLLTRWPRPAKAPALGHAFASLHLNDP